MHSVQTCTYTRVCVWVACNCSMHGQERAVHELLRRCGRCLCGTCHKRPSRTCPRRLSPRCSVRIPPHQHYRVPGVPFTLLECPKYLECPLPPWSAQTAVHSCRRRARCGKRSRLRHFEYHAAHPSRTGHLHDLAPKSRSGCGGSPVSAAPSLHVALAVAGEPRSIKLLYDRVLPGKYSRSRRTNLEEKVRRPPSAFCRRSVLT
jgi:hypothetical protein